VTGSNPNTFLRLMIERCIRAFIAAAGAAAAAGLVNPSLSADGLRTLAVGAGAAGISAVMSILSQWIGDPNSTSFTKVQVGQ
jgi:hypothetical protein